MFYFIIILILIVCVLLVLAVLIQNPKGGGLGAGFGNMGNQVMGARRATDFIEKFTWGMVVALLVLTLASGFIIKKGTTGKSTIATDNVDNRLKENSGGTAAPQAAPQPGAQGPQQPAAPAQPAGQPK